MNRNYEEKRKFPRAFFNMEHGITGVFAIPKTQTKPIKAVILNISAGGLFFSVKTDERNKVQKGDELLFIELREKSSLPMVLNLKAEVVWIADNTDLEYTGMGCKFTNVSDDARDRLNKFVKSWQDK